MIDGEEIRAVSALSPVSIVLSTTARSLEVSIFQEYLRKSGYKKIRKKDSSIAFVLLIFSEHIPIFVYIYTHIFKKQQILLTNLDRYFKMIFEISKPVSV